MTYLNTLIDDVAVLIVRVTTVNLNLQRNAMSELISNFPQDGSRVAKLIKRAKDDDSWWNKGFKKKLGARQRLVHNQYFVEFQLSGGEASASLISPDETPGDDNPVIAEEDFLDCVRSVLTSLFDWLDELEDALAEILQMPTPDGGLHETYYPLPIGYPPGTTRYESRYFVVPLCDDSDPLPLEITVRACSDQLNGSSGMTPQLTSHEEI